MTEINEQYEKRFRQDLASLADRVSIENLENKVMYRVQRRTRFRRIAIAGGIAAMLILGCCLMYLRSATPISPPSFAMLDLDKTINDAGISTQLLLSAQALAQTPGGDNLARENFQYIIARYPNTLAAHHAHEQIHNLYNRRVIQ